MTYEVVTYRPELKRQVTELQRHLWSPDPALNAAYLEWKHEQNPYVEAPLIHLALHRGQVVGMRGMFGARWQVGDPPRTFLAPCAGDLVVAPDHRNRGLVLKILETAVNDLANGEYAYIFSLSASPATQLGSLMAGWRGAGSLELAHRRPPETAGRGDPWAAAWRRARRLDTASGRVERLVDRWGGKPRPFRALDRNGTRGGLEASRHVSLEPAQRPKAMAALVERIGGDGRIRHVRDREYFAWRFRNLRSLYRLLF